MIRSEVIVLIELLVAAALTAPGMLDRTEILRGLDPVPAAEVQRLLDKYPLARGGPVPMHPALPRVPDGRLPNDGRACLVVETCDPRPCIRPATPGPGASRPIVGVAPRLSPTPCGPPQPDARRPGLVLPAGTG